MPSSTNASDAIASVDAKKWNATGIEERVKLLKEIQSNLLRCKQELGVAEAKIRNDCLGEPHYSKEVGLLTTVVPMGNVVTASIDLYETLLK